MNFMMFMEMCGSGCKINIASRCLAGLIHCTQAPGRPALFVAVVGTATTRGSCALQIATGGNPGEGFRVRGVPPGEDIVRLWGFYTFIHCGLFPLGDFFQI